MGLITLKTLKACFRDRSPPPGHGPSMTYFGSISESAFYVFRRFSVGFHPMGPVWPDLSSGLFGPCRPFTVPDPTTNWIHYQVSTLHRGRGRAAAWLPHTNSGSSTSSRNRLRSNRRNNSSSVSSKSSGLQPPVWPWGAHRSGRRNKLSRASKDRETSNEVKTS